MDAAKDHGVCMCERKQVGAKGCECRVLTVKGTRHPQRHAVSEAVQQPLLWCEVTSCNKNSLYVVMFI